MSRSDVSDFLSGEGLELAVACMRSSMTLERTSGAKISRLRPVIFCHHSAEYLPPIIASRLRINSAQSEHNRGKIMYAVCHPKEIPKVELGTGGWG
jgi:hypothetical protein